MQASVRVTLLLARLAGRAAGRPRANAQGGGRRSRRRALAAQDARDASAAGGAGYRRRTAHLHRGRSNPGRAGQGAARRLATSSCAAGARSSPPTSCTTRSRRMPSPPPAMCVSTGWATWSPATGPATTSTPSAGYIDYPTYNFRQFGARGKANRLVIVDRDVYRAERATYTNCAVGDDDWYLKVGRVDLDRLTDVGVARNASVYFKDVPIFYTPWMDFPLTSRRKTGFLAPTDRHRQQQRIRDRDAVLLEHRAQPRLHLCAAPDGAPRAAAQQRVSLPRAALRRRGPLRLSARRPDPERNALVRVVAAQPEVLGPADRATSTSRACRTTPISPTCPTNIAATSQTNLPREGALTYNGDWWTLFGRAPEVPDPAEPGFAAGHAALRARPAAGAEGGAAERAAASTWTSSAKWSNFQQTGLVSGWRQVYYPSASYPYRNRLFWVTPKLGFN